MKIALCLMISLFCAAGGKAANFDGDGVADEFTIIRDAAKAAESSGIQLVNPWQAPPASKQKPKGLGLRIRLGRASQTYLLHDSRFFQFVDLDRRQAARESDHEEGCVIRRMEKQVSGLQGDAMELGNRGGH